MSDELTVWKQTQEKKRKRKVVFDELKKAGQKPHPMLRKMLDTDHAPAPHKAEVTHEFIAFDGNAHRGQRLIETDANSPPIVMQGGAVGTNSPEIAKFLEAQPGIEVQRVRRDSRKYFSVNLPWKT